MLRSVGLHGGQNVRKLFFQTSVFNPFIKHIPKIFPITVGGKKNSPLQYGPLKGLVSKDTRMNKSCSLFVLHKIGFNNIGF